MVPRGDGIATPPRDRVQLVELARAFAEPAPAPQVHAVRIEHPHLVGAAVRDQNAAVGEGGGLSDAVEKVGVLAFGLADRDRGFGADLPAESGSLGGAGVFGDADVGAVAEEGGGEGGGGVGGTGGEEEGERDGGGDDSGSVIPERFHLVAFTVSGADRFEGMTRGRVVQSDRAIAGRRCRGYLDKEGQAAQVVTYDLH